MILFLDASAFLKLYVAEPGSGALRRAVRNATAVLAVDRTYVEVRATLERAAQLGLVRARSAEQAKGDFERDWQSVSVVSPDAPMLRRAADLAEAHALDASHAINVAAAESLARQIGGAVSFRMATAVLPDAITARLTIKVMDLSARSGPAGVS